MEQFENTNHSENNYKNQIIKHYFYIINYEKLRLIVDIVSLMEEKSIHYNFSNKRLIKNEKIIELSNSKIELNNNKKALFDLCIRIKLTKNTLIYTLQNHENTDIILKEINTFIEEGNGEKEIFDTKIIKKKQYKDFILPLEEALKLQSIEKINIGYTAEIEIMRIDEKNKKNIEDKLNQDIDDIIVKKNFSVSEYLKSESSESEITDRDIINALGGIEGLLNREINVLKKVFGYKYFPYLLCIDRENKCIYMTYCGKSLNKDNIPVDWMDQINDCIQIFNQEKIYHNDLWSPNILVLNNVIKIIDFGFGSFNNESFPFTNLEKNKEYSNFFDYLDMCVKKGGEKRIKFHQILNNKKNLKKKSEE